MKIPTELDDPENLEATNLQIIEALGLSAVTAISIIVGIGIMLCT